MMRMTEMKLIGRIWQVMDDNGNSFLMARQGSETLADAAARFEDTMRQLQEGTLKPLNADLG